MVDPVLFDVQTEFNHYQVTDTIYSGRPARVLYSGDHVSAQSGVAHDDNPNLLFDYNQRLLELVRGVGPKKLLVIGGGAFTLPTALMKEFPKMEMEIVELDEVLFDIARNYFDFRPSRRVKVRIGDGRGFLDNTKRDYDMIIVDVFMDSSIPASFQTADAARVLRRRLRPRGVVAMNVIAATQGTRSALLHRLRDAMGDNFDKVTVFPASSGLSPWTVQNFVLTAQLGTADLERRVRYKPLELNQKRA